MSKKMIIILSSIFGTIATLVLAVTLFILNAQNFKINEQRQYEVVSEDVRYASPDGHKSQAYLVGLSDAGRKKDTIVVPFEVDGKVISGLIQLHNYDHDFSSAKTLYLGAMNYQINLLKIGKNSTVYACHYSIYDNILSTESQLYTDKATYKYILEHYKDTSRVHLAPVVFEFRYKRYEYRYATSLEDGRIHDLPILGNDGDYTFDGWTLNDELIDINSTFKSDNLLLNARFIETNALGFTFDGDTLVKCNLKDAKEIVIPDKVYNKRISHIADDAFANLPNLEKITIPDGFDRIGHRAFKNDTNLKEIVFETDRSLLEFGNYVFDNCPRLESIELPRAVTISNNTFHNSSIKSINLDKNDNYTIVDNMIIKDRCVISAIPGKEEYNIPSYVTTIFIGAFANNNTVKKVNLNNVKIVWANAFDSSTLSEITCSEETVFLAPAFNNTPYIDKQTDDLVILGKSLIKINSTENTIVVPDNVKSIACDTNPSNKKMIISKSVNNIRNVDLTSLDEVIMLAEKFSGYISDNIFKDDVIVYVPSTYMYFYTLNPEYSGNDFKAYANNVKALDIVITYKEEGSSEEHILNTKFGATLYRRDIYNGRKFEYFLDDEGNKYYALETLLLYQDTTLTAVYGDVTYYI